MMPVFRPVGCRALLAGFSDRATPDALARVRALDRALSATPFAGFAEAVPTQVSLLVVFDPLATDHAMVEAALRALLSAPPPPEPPPRLHKVPVCYDTELAPDLDAVARAVGLLPEAVITAHLSGDYAVAMVGFAPGYAYLDGVPQALHLPRKARARRDVPAGSVLVAGGQCIVSTLTMPTGWWILGRSPLRVLTDDPARPFLLGAGDRVRFRRIDRMAFEAASRCGR